ncbi:DUF4258 domain-containing protein [Pleurocapsales cyanobacterium LEGE 10410]|nr:DUF4258 domain-containing protein [Pleurocapsales cyanobacterium LEGE 10410]
MPPSLAAIREKIKQNDFELSKHAVDQSIIRNIRIAEIKEAIAQGKVIEDYPDDKYGASCLIVGFTVANRPLHIQCSYPSRPLIKIITIYQPSFQRWNNSFTKRKPK